MIREFSQGVGPGSGRPILVRLAARGLLSERDIVDGEVKVSDVSRRNQNFRVTTTSGRSYFVKQGVGAARSMTVGREAEFFRFASDAPASAQLRQCLPTVRDWDAERKMLIFDLIPDSRSLAEHQQRTRRWPSRLAGQAGSALAALHAWWPRDVGHENSPITVAGPPWIFSIHQPDLSVLDSMTSAALEIVRIVQGSGIFRDALDELRNNWRATAVVHGDMKWDNVVLRRCTNGRRGYDVVLVDWELAQLGDPLWDAASFLSQYVDAWIASFPVMDESSLSGSPTPLVPLERLQPAMSRFWNAYTRGFRFDETVRADGLDRLARYAAARLIQTSIEAEQRGNRLSNAGVLRLQVAENIMRQPAAALASLFGIPE